MTDVIATAGGLFLGLLAVLVLIGVGDQLRRLCDVLEAVRDRMPPAAAPAPRPDPLRVGLCRRCGRCAVEGDRCRACFARVGV